MSEGGHVLNSLPGVPGGFSLLASEAVASTAVIFVHGWGGDAHTTWLDFPSLIDSRVRDYPWWSACDAYFYRYPKSKTAPVAVTAANFASFLHSVFPTPRPSFFAASAEFASLVHAASVLSLRDAGFEYANLVLVGHSEGALIVRRALIEIYKDIRDSGKIPTVKFPATYTDMLGQTERAKQEFHKQFPVMDSRVVLFAPAHLGAPVRGWAGVILSVFNIWKFSKPVIDAARSYSMTDYDLSPGSATLRQLQTDTERFAEAFPQPGALRAQCYFGEEDRIVTPGEYSTDPKSVYVSGMNHTSICKPTLQYEKPLEYVRHDRSISKTAS